MFTFSNLTSGPPPDAESTTDRVFRGSIRGSLTGPYVSQLLLKPIPYGSGYIHQKYNVPIANSDFMTAVSEWSQLQTGILPWLSVTYDEKPRYIRNGRDLAEYVHYDFANQAYLSAALILINANAKSIHNCNQFKSGSNPYRYSTVEEGFATFGPAEAVDWIGRVTTAALKAAYFQKWCVHRRVRPEALGGLIHFTRTGKREYPVHKSLLNAAAVDAVHGHTGTYLLPQAYPEGCPIHPSYPSGHAAVAGACSVVLKACFDGSMVLPDCVQPAEDGLSLLSCKDYFPTINQEIDKLAFNVAMGRDWAGIHFNSDTVAGLALGESVGIAVLQDLARTYTETFAGFRLTRFDGRTIMISSQGNISFV
jgi:membrane-associated phospholipid phosphatase